MYKILKNKQNMYRHVFGNEGGKVVLADLRNFCHATKTTAIKNDGRIDPYEMMRMEGRREVFLQIASMLNVDFDDFYKYEEEIGYGE